MARIRYVCLCFLTLILILIDSFIHFINLSGRDEWDRLIELFIEVAIPQSNSNDTNNNNNNGDNTNNGHGDDDDDEEPWILRTYPTDYSNREVLNSVPHFAYPCPFKW